MIYNKFYILRCCLLFTAIFFLNKVYSGTLSSKADTRLSEKIYNSTYHFRFRHVDSLISANETLYANNLNFNLAVVNYYWWRLISSEKNAIFSTRLSQRIEKLKDFYDKKKTGQDKQELFMLISIYSYSARVSLLNYSYYSAITDLSQYYSLIKKSFGHEEEFKALYLTSGLYYFFAGYTKENMPLLSPLLYCYTLGNTEKGIQYIMVAGTFGSWEIQQEAKYFLMKINFDLNKNYLKAAKYCNQLLESYPENLLFQLYMLRINIALDQVSTANNRLTIIERTARDNNQLTSDEKDYYISQAKAVIETDNKKTKR